jgi:hypothetical protein
MNTHIIPEFTILNASAAVIIGFMYIAISSFISEPNRQKISAVIIAGAGAVYWNGGLGIWEYVFASAMLFMAFKGLSKYYFIGIAWLMHTSWDTIHHLYASPIVPFSPSSSAGCAVCDVILALWFFGNAPSVFAFLGKRNDASNAMMNNHLS